MYEFLANPPWWVVLLIGWLMPVAFKKLRHKVPHWMDHTKGALRKRWRRYNSRRLLKIKARRFDSLLITREITKSYAFMTLFVMSIMLYGIGLLLIPDALRKSDAGISFWGIATGLPMLVFEFIWLTSMNRVDVLIHYRGKIRRRHNRMI